MKIGNRNEYKADVSSVSPSSADCLVKAQYKRTVLDPCAIACANCGFFWQDSVSAFRQVTSLCCLKYSCVF